LEKLKRGENVVKYIKVPRIKWWGHLNRWKKTETVRKVIEWNPTEMRYEGRQKIDGNTMC
jgi:hypothetical protein